MPKLPAKNLSNLHYYLMVQDLHSVIRGHSWSLVCAFRHDQGIRQDPRL